MSPVINTVPLLVTVMVWGVAEVLSATVPKPNELGLRVSKAPKPVPISGTECPLMELLSLIDRVPLREPAAAGVNVTWIVQLLPTASEAGQLLVWLKSPLLLIPVMESAVVPVLLNVTVCVALGVPTVTLPKLSDGGVTTPTGPVPLPVNETLGVPTLVDT